MANRRVIVLTAHESRSGDTIVSQVRRGRKLELVFQEHRCGSISQHSQDLSKRSTLNRMFVQAGEQGTCWQELVLLVGMVPLHESEKRGERFLLLGGGSPQELERTCIPL